MTMPDERTRALTQTREFLQELLSSDTTPGVPDQVRRSAKVLLRHLPGNSEVQQFHRLQPDYFGAAPGYLEKNTGAQALPAATPDPETHVTDAEELARLRIFFGTVANLTLRHKSLTVELADGQPSGYAVVWPSDLGVALEAVNPQWFTAALRSRTAMPMPK